MTKIRFSFLALLLVLAAVMVAQTGATKNTVPKASAPKSSAGASAAPGESTATADAVPTLLPGPAQVDAALKRTLGYDTALSWQVVDIRPSGIPDVAEIIVSINKQEPIRIYWSSATQMAIIGNMMPFGPNPFAEARAKLQSATGPSQGSQNAVVSIVDFSDLQCPHCKAAQPILEKLVADFPQVRLVFEQFPLPATLHPWAMKAALYADCAARMDNQAFWKYVDAVFENQGGIATATADEKLKELATASGLDAAKVAACSTTVETEARVRKSLELGQSLNVNSTPSVFINGRLLPGINNIPYEQLKALVQFEIDHAGK
jgi:protein-disulfide isomerase